MLCGVGESSGVIALFIVVSKGDEEIVALSQLIYQSLVIRL